MFRYSKKDSMVEREEKNKVFEKRYPYVVLQNTPYRERKDKENHPQYSPIK